VHTHFERHRTGRAGWLRAAVLGADDGILSTASLMIGVAASGAGRTAVLTAGLAGLSAGASAMAIGEYVSVGSQADAEAADRAREARELKDDPVAERDELRRIYVERGLPEDLAREVAASLHRRDPLAAHLRDELGHTPASAARPLQASLASAGSFAVGGVLPVGAAAVAPSSVRSLVVAVAALAALVGLGALGASLGGANLRRGMLRVGLGGLVAMIVTYGIGQLVGTTVG
jgi:VIT1/CCC1 family predicted Fe2+/Mn2+ transporter